MFDLIEDRKKLEIKWWTIPGAVFLIFYMRIDLGILIGRRSIDPFDCMQFLLFFLIALAILWPIGAELAARRTAERKEQDVR